MANVNITEVKALAQIVAERCADHEATERQVAQLTREIAKLKEEIAVLTAAVEGKRAHGPV